MLKLIKVTNTPSSCPIGQLRLAHGEQIECHDITLTFTGLIHNCAHAQTVCPRPIFLLSQTGLGMRLVGVLFGGGVYLVLCCSELTSIVQVTQEVIWEGSFAELNVSILACLGFTTTYYGTCMYMLCTMQN